jgi:[protein-PII] uridylyltransferase
MMYALPWTTTETGVAPATASARSRPEPVAAQAVCEDTPGRSARHVLRAIATEPATGRRRWLERVRPLVDREHALLQARFEADGCVEALMRDRTRLADGVVLGLLSLARAAVSGDVTALAPVTIVGVGGYGRRELAPASDLDLLFLLGDAAGPHGYAERVIGFMLAGLWDLGFAVGHATRTVAECRTLAAADPIGLASLLDTRFLAGSSGRYAAFEASFRGAASGPAAEVVAGAIVRQLRTSSARPHADHSAEQPDVKRDRGGLRDIQGLLWLATLAHADPASQPAISRVPPAVIQARHFLWRVRAHLHLLAGRAQDRLLFELQPLVARRLGLEDHGAATGAARLLELYREHTRSVCALLRTQ